MEGRCPQHHKRVRNGCGGYVSTRACTVGLSVDYVALLRVCDRLVLYVPA